MINESLSPPDVPAIRQTQNNRRSAARQPFVLALAFLCIFGFLGTARAQEEEKPKVPGLDKIIAANQHLMFTGKIKSIDLDHNTLIVGSVEGSDTEIFPVKHNTKVLTSDGYRKKIDALSPGTQVIVYYDQRSDRRTVTRIDLYTSETKKKEPQS